MAHFAQKSLATAMIILSFLAADLALAATTKSMKTVQATEDPDLKLSIEELRKKYPIDWMKRKYGDLKLCGDEYEPASENPPKNLVCDFNEHQHSISNFSEREIRSSVVNVNFNSGDHRMYQIAGFVFKYFEEKPDSLLTLQERNLKTFIYSKHVVARFQNDDNCITFKKINRLRSWSCPEDKLILKKSKF